MRFTGAYLFGLGAVVLGLSPLPVAAQKDKDDAKARAPFQGAWNVVKLEIMGQDVTAAIKDMPATMSFDGNKYVFDIGPETEKGTFTFDAKAKPATLDLKILEGRGKGKSQLAVYEVEGDTLKICMADEDAKDRPKKLASEKGGAGMVMFTLTRKKKD